MTEKSAVRYSDTFARVRKFTYRYRFSITNVVTSSQNRNEGSLVESLARHFERQLSLKANTPNLVLQAEECTGLCLQRCDV